VVSAVLLTSTLWEPSARAEAPAPTPHTFAPLDAFHSQLGIDVGYGWLRDDQAETAQIGTNGVAFGISLGAELFDVVTTSGYFGTVFVADESPFSQGVVNQAGDASTAESSLNLYIFGLSAGLRTPTFVLSEPAENGAFAGGWTFLRGGMSWQSASRSVTNCIDCNVEDIDLGNGPYLEAGAALGLVNPDGLGLFAQLYYRQYFGDAAVRRSVHLSVGFSYF
jgi:hypothetical protein